jgi:hypothetical protein
LAWVDFAADYKSTAAPPPPEPDPFANYVEPAGNLTTQNYAAWNTPAPVAQPAAPPAAPPTYNYEYDTWQDTDGRLWDRASNLWYSITDPSNPLVYRPEVGWQNIPEYNDYNTELNSIAEYQNKPLESTPSWFTPQPLGRQISAGEWQNIQSYMDRPEPSPRADFINYDLATSKNVPFPEDVRYSLENADLPYEIRDGAKWYGAPAEGGGLTAPWDKYVEPAAAKLGDAYNWYTRNIQNPVAETGAQLTPAFLSAAKLAPPIGGLVSAGAALTGYDTEGNALRGIKDLGSAISDPGSFVETQNQNLAERPAWQQMAATSVYDPLNLVGAGLGTKALASGALEGGGLLSTILRGGAKLDKGIDAAQTAILGTALRPIGKALSPLASEAGSLPASLAIKAGAGAAAGAGTYALSDDDDPRTRLLKSLAVATGVALGPDAIKAGASKIPTRGKTGFTVDAANALASPEPMELGYGGADEALARKTATTSKAGRIGQLAGKVPWAKDAAALVNPSIELDPAVHVANQASAAVKADWETRLASTRKPMVDQLEDAFGKFEMGDDGVVRGAKGYTYTGPDDRVIKGSLVDMKENPQDYILTPIQNAALELWTLRDNMSVNLARSRYGADIGLYAGENPGASYVPHINTNKDLVEQGVTTEARLRSPAIGKHRSYDTAAQRMAADETFIPETDPRRLIEYHDNTIARMASQETFKKGVGGMTRVEVLELARPELVAAKKNARKMLDSLKGAMERRLQKEGDLAGAIRKNLTKTREIDERMAPLLDRIHVLEQVGDYGPELSHLTGQVYELRRQEAALSRLVEGTKKKPGMGAKIITNDKEIQSLRARIDTAQKVVDDLVKAYSNADITKDGFVRSDYTFRYHSPEVKNSIEKVKELPGDHNLLHIADKAKGTALSSDGSPITIQGVTQFYRDPISTTKAWALMMLERGPSLDDVARREPELVSRYVQARARALGQVSDEFDPTHSIIASIPKVGRGFVHTENAMFNAIQRVDYETWKTTRSLLEKLNPGVASDILDHEAANAISKTNPSLSSVERGVSPARARLERTAFTSVSFMASPALVLKDAGSAVVKLAMGQRPRGREQVALAHLLTMSTTIMGLSTASAVATADSRNMSPEEALKRVFNPGRKDFMSLYLPGGKRIPLGGPYRSFIKAMAPMDADMNLRVPQLLSWANGRLAPAVGAGVDIVRNRDFDGDRVRSGNDLSQSLDSAYYLIEQGVFPLGAGGALETIRKGGSPGEVAAEFAGQMMGNPPQAQTPTDKLDSISRAWPGNEGRDFYKSPPSVQAGIKELHGDLWKEAVEAGSEERKAAYAKEQELLGNQLASDDLLKNNDITAAQWREERSKRYDALRENKEGIYALKDGGSLDSRLQGYFDALSKATGPSGQVDWDRVEAYTLTLPTEDRQYIEDNTGLGLRTDKTKEYRADMKTIQDAGYWDLSDKLWEAFSRQYDVAGAATPEQYWGELRKALIAHAEGKLTGKYGEEWRTNTPNAAVELGDIAYGKAKGKYDDVLSEMRKKWRAEHPEEGKILAKWQLGGTGQEETLNRIDKANR